MQSAPMREQGKPRARRLVVQALAAALACVLLVAGLGPRPAAAAQRPNIVLIQTDDQTLSSLYGSHRPMPNVLRRIGKRGVTFTNYYASYPLCCPSRATLLTGRYAHNHQVRGNVPPGGGYPRFDKEHNLSVWLHRAGYRTVHVGKFLNFYGEVPFSDPNEVPPGWSQWHTLVAEPSAHLYYGYRLNDNGVVSEPFGDPGDPATRQYGVKDSFGCPGFPDPGTTCNYVTDVLSGIAVRTIEESPTGQPLFLSLDYNAPHGDLRSPSGPEPAPRHYGAYSHLQLPRPPGFNEGDVHDKPRFIRDAPFLTQQEIHQAKVEYQKSLESLRSVDEGVSLVMQALSRTGRLRNTFVFFTSDNGFFEGEHRLQRAKFLAYEPATHLPLLVRGPGIPKQSRSGELVANVDLAPTILDIANASADRRMDGRSFLRFARKPQLRSDRPILFESFVETTDVAPNQARTSISAPPKDYVGIRLGTYKYIEWPTGEKELYNLESDPNELNSRHRDPRLFPIRNYLRRQLHRLIDCLGVECRQKPSQPLPEPRRPRRPGGGQRGAGR
jgi:N-acetylglucosamine-6-sulfatase